MEDHLDFLDSIFSVTKQIFTLVVTCTNRTCEFWFQVQSHEHEYRPLSVDKVAVGLQWHC